MDVKKRKISRLLQNNKLLVGDHEPRSALLNKSGKQNSSLSKHVSSRSYLTNVSDAFSSFGNNNFGSSEELNRFETYEEYRDYKHRKRKERKNSR